MPTTATDNQNIESEAIREVEKFESGTGKHPGDTPVNSICDYCGSIKARMTTWKNERTGDTLNLCFLGCQNFPEPFRQDRRGRSWSDSDKWNRIDQYQDYVKTLPKLRKAPKTTEEVLDLIRPDLEKMRKNPIIEKETGQVDLSSWIPSLKTWKPIRTDSFGKAI